MKKELLKRIAVLAMAAAMVLTMTATAFAADLGTNGKVGSSSDPAGNSVVLKKAIKVTNYSGYAYEPTITYTYTLSNGTASGKVTDSQGVTANFKAGQVSYLAQSSAAVQTAVFSNSNTATSGENATKDLTWTFDPSKFPSAGVYRYVLAETNTSVAPASIGIDRPANYDTSKYLDVYVQNGASGLVIYGYVLVDDEASAVTDDSAKSQGWNAGDDLDTYDTYNVTITKSITGTLADKTAKYPFTVALTGKMDAANVAVDGTGDSITLTQDGEAKGTLGDGKTLIIKGLPKTVKFTVSETNPTSDQYTTTSTANNITGATVVTDQALAGSASLTVVSGGDISKASNAVEIAVENKLDAISPTNVVVRFAPYLFILAAAAMLLILKSRRNKEEK